MQKGLLTATTVKKLNFKNPRWRTAAILKKRHMTDLDKIWHCDARWSPAPDVKFKFLIFDTLIWQVAAI